MVLASEMHGRGAGEAHLDGQRAGENRGHAARDLLDASRLVQQGRSSTSAIIENASISHQASSLKTVNQPTHSPKTCQLQGIISNCRSSSTELALHVLFLHKSMCLGFASMVSNESKRLMRTCCRQRRWGSPCCNPQSPPQCGPPASARTLPLHPHSRHTPTAQHRSLLQNTVQQNLWTQIGPQAQHCFHSQR